MSQLDLLKRELSDVQADARLFAREGMTKHYMAAKHYEATLIKDIEKLEQAPSPSEEIPLFNSN
jgi:hypothetical protein